jgi:hypothetical protein
MKRLSILVSAAVISAFAAGLGPGQAATADDAVPSSQIRKSSDAARQWILLFDGKSLDGWKTSDFPGQGEVEVAEGAIILGAGMDLTGVTIDRKIPQVNYEIELEAMRADGSDFFCGLTFPVKDQFCSLIVGGWGGGVIGLSSLNGFDASENETTGYRVFEKGKWYPIRLRVTDQRITAWIDGKEEVDVDIRETELSTRIEVEWSKPFGFASWQTKAALRKIRLRELPPDEVKKINAELDRE